MSCFGRKAVLDAGERRKIAERYAAGETMAALAREYKVGQDHGLEGFAGGLNRSWGRDGKRGRIDRPGCLCK